MIALVTRDDRDGISLELRLRVKCQCREKKESGSLQFTVFTNNIKLKGVTFMLLPDNKKVSLTVQEVDVKGVVVPFNPSNPPVFSVNNPDVLSLQPDPTDPSTMWAVAGLPGTAQIDCTIQSANGPIHGTLDVEVVPSEAVSVKIVAGTPVAQ